MKTKTIAALIFLLITGMGCQKEEDCSKKVECLHTWYNYLVCDDDPDQMLERSEEYAPLISTTKKEEIIFFSVCEYEWQMTENIRSFQESIDDMRNRGYKLSAQLREEFRESLICFP